VARLDALPVYCRNSPANAPAYDATGNRINYPASSVSALGVNAKDYISRVHIRQ